MTVDYFPDCNILIFYLGEHHDNHAYAQAIFDATGQNSELRGHLLTGVNREFTGITSNNNLNKSVEFIVDAVDKVAQSNSKPNLCAKLEDLKDDRIYPSQRIVVGELIPRIGSLEKVDSVQFRKLAFTVFKEFKNRREILIAKLQTCDEQRLNEFTNKESSKVESLRKELVQLFPIKVDNDKKDNDHLLKAACHSALMKANTWFVTDDAFRRASRADKNTTFEAMAEKALKTISGLFGIELRIRRIEQFVKELKLVPKAG